MVLGYTLESMFRYNYYDEGKARKKTTKAFINKSSVRMMSYLFCVCNSKQVWRSGAEQTSTN